MPVTSHVVHKTDRFFVSITWTEEFGPRAGHSAARHSPPLLGARNSGGRTSAIRSQILSAATPYELFAPNLHWPDPNNMLCAGEDAEMAVDISVGMVPESAVASSSMPCAGVVRVTVRWRPE